MKSCFGPLLLILFAPICSAQILTVGLNKLAGQSAESTTTIGAVANRKTADSLYQQSLADEKAAWSSFPPNVGLLSKALKEAQDGISADDQSHSMAQEAMHSTATGTNAGQYNASDYNAMGVDDISKMATSSSSLYPQVAAKLQSYGLKLSEDKQLMTTPFGNFPTNASAQQMADVIKQMANKFGLSGAGVDQGIAAAQQATQAISQKVMADVKAKMNTLNASKNGGTKDDSEAEDGKGKGNRELAGKAADVPNPDKNGIDWDERARKVNAFRERMQEEEGVEPIWSKNDDLFKKIHEHYVMLDKQKLFLSNDTKQMVAGHP
jgi:hypothetical protein